MLYYIFAWELFQDELRKKMQNECFICGLEWSVFEKYDGVRNTFVALSHK